jgi:hypothetical protein
VDDELAAQKTMSHKCALCLQLVRITEHLLRNYLWLIARRIPSAWCRSIPFNSSKFPTLLFSISSISLLSLSILCCSASISLSNARGLPLQLEACAGFALLIREELLCEVVDVQLQIIDRLLTRGDRCDLTAHPFRLAAHDRLEAPGIYSRADQELLLGVTDGNRDPHLARKPHSKRGE